MKFASLVAFASLVCGALGQSIEIGSPSKGSQIEPGKSFTVQVIRPDTLTGSKEVAIVISLLDCPGKKCPNPVDALGNTLYSGLYDPKFPRVPTLTNEPEQNFTVKTPNDFTCNTTAQLSVVHLALVGASRVPLFEIKNITLHVK